jgi:hypothetical protein
MVWHLDAEGQIINGISGGNWSSNMDVGEVLISVQWSGTAPNPLTPASRTGIVPLHFTGRNQPRERSRLELHVVGAQSSPFGLSFASNWEPIEGDSMTVSWGDLYAFARGAGQIEVRNVLQRDHRVTGTARFGFDLVEEGRRDVLAAQAEMIARARDFATRCTRYIAGADGRLEAISPRP